MNSSYSLQLKMFIKNV